MARIWIVAAQLLERHQDGHFPAATDVPAPNIEALICLDDVSGTPGKRSSLESGKAARKRFEEDSPGVMRGACPAYLAGLDLTVRTSSNAWLSNVLITACRLMLSRAAR